MIQMDYAIGEGVGIYIITAIIEILDQFLVGDLIILTFIENWCLLSLRYLILHQILFVFFYHLIWIAFFQVACMTFWIDGIAAVRVVSVVVVKAASVAGVLLPELNVVEVMKVILAVVTHLLEVYELLAAKVVINVTNLRAIVSFITGHDNV